MTYHPDNATLRQIRHLARTLETDGAAILEAAIAVRREIKRKPIMPAKLLMPADGLPLTEKVKLSTYLHAVAGTAKAHFPNTVHIAKAISALNGDLSNSRLPPDMWEGAEAEYDSAAPSKAYKFSVVGGRIRLRYHKGAWRVVSAQKRGRSSGASATVTLLLTDDQKRATHEDWIADRMLVLFGHGN